MPKYKATTRVEVLPKEADVVVAAPVELAGAAILIDDVAAGTLWPEGLLRRNAFFGMFAGSLPKSTRSIGRLRADAGEHELKIEKEGYAVIIKSFVHEGTRPTEVLIDDAAVKRE